MKLRKKVDKLAAVRELFADFNENCQKTYTIGKYVTIDEKWGRCSFCRYIPSKPAKYGIKIFALVESRNFYSYNMEIYVGQEPKGSFRVENSPLEITKCLWTPLFKSGENITMDNWCMSYLLAKELLSKKLTIIGTLKRNKDEIPTEIVEKKTKKVYSSIFGFQKNVTLVMYVSKRMCNFVTYNALQ
ncbi:PiggyBac transposable element-derived protein 4, partial [Stegodyphus mimosarum]